MKYLSICSGIEAATVAWHHLGWQPAGFAEIEKFPAAVLKHHYPTVPNFGDLTKHDTWSLASGAVDLLVGGTPCQAFSVAGLRRGMDDARGQLTLEFVRLAARLRPRWIVWENVPGVLSSGRGRDFGSFLGALGELGYGWAYRILDAQYFGVAQRRRRVFVVGYLGDWRRAAAVLFERESLRRDSAPSREAREGVAAGIKVGAIGCRIGAQRAQNAQNGHLIAAKCISRGEGYKYDFETCTLLPVGTDCYNGTITGDVAATIGTPGSSVNASGPTVMQPVAFHNRQDPDVSGDITHPLGAKDNGLAVAQPVAFKGDIARSLTARYDSSPCADRGMNVVAVAQPMAFAQNTRDEVRLMGGDGSIVGALAAQPGMKQTCYVAQPVAFSAKDYGADASEIAPTLRAMSHTASHANGGGQVAVAQSVAFSHSAAAHSYGVAQVVEGTPPLRGGGAGNSMPAVVTSMTVRRLTPVECERLQGFHDGYTDIRPRGKDTPDGPRYKALGNSMAVPVMRWIGERINMVDKL